MKVGKLPNDVLHDIVIGNIKNKRKEVIVGAGIGEDNAIIDYGEEVCVLSTDPITGATKGLGKLAIHISCNDCAASGAEPIGILFTILAPEGTDLEELEEIMKDAGQVSEQLDIEIVGGHTEITNAVNRIVVSTTVIGKQRKDRIPDKDRIRVGDKVLLTKYAAIEGTSILAKEREDFLRSSMSQEELEEAKNLDRLLSVVKEGRIAGEIGVHYMHDITEGGVLGAVWEAAVAIGKGIRINQDLIPVKEVSRKLTGLLGLDPYRLISSGSMLIIADEDKLGRLEEELASQGIGLSVIGEVIEEGIIIEKDSKLVEIDSPGTDELYRGLDF